MEFHSHVIPIRPKYSPQEPGFKSFDFKIPRERLFAHKRTSYTYGFRITNDIRNGSTARNCMHVFTCQQIHAVSLQHIDSILGREGDM